MSWLDDAEAEFERASWIRPEPPFDSKSCPAVLSWRQLDRLLRIARAADAVAWPSPGNEEQALDSLRTALADQEPDDER